MSKKTMIFFLFLTLLFLGISFFGFFHSKERVLQEENIQKNEDTLKENEKNEEKKKEEEKYKNTIFDENIPFKKSNIEWEEYTSKEFHFSMKYPKGWIISSNDVCLSGGYCNEIHIWFPSSFQKMQEWKKRNVAEQSPSPDILIAYEDMSEGHRYLLQGSETIEEFIEKHRENFPFVQNIDIDGKKTWMIKNQHGYPVYYIYTIHDEKIYEIFIKSEDESIITPENILDFTREFLSNFKFEK